VTLDSSFKKPDQPKYFPMAKFELTSAYQATDFVTLYDSTFLRGSSVQIEDSIADMTDKHFKNKATSFSINGNVCWIFYEKPNFQGSEKKFYPGKYGSSSELGAFFRNIGSIKKLNYC
jgi:hypothetical protein